MSDLIDRQVAINALINLWADKPFGNPALTEIKECVERVPSAQPEIVRCRDCKHWKNKHLCESLSRYGSYETKADFYCGYAERKTND